MCCVCDVILCAVLWEWHKESATAPENQAFHSINDDDDDDARDVAVSKHIDALQRVSPRKDENARARAHYTKKRRNGCLKTKHARRRRCNIRRIYHREQQTNVCKRNSSARRRRRASLSVVPRCGERTRCAMCVDMLCMLYVCIYSNV